MLSSERRATRLQMYLDPRVPQSKEVPTLLIAGGAPTEGESEQNIDPVLTD